MSCPANEHASARAIFSLSKAAAPVLCPRAAPPGAGNAAEAEKSLAPRVERHGADSGVRTNPQGRQAFRVCPALLSTPWRFHNGNAHLPDATLAREHLTLISRPHSHWLFVVP